MDWTRRGLDPLISDTPRAYEPPFLRVEVVSQFIHIDSFMLYPRCILWSIKNSYPTTKMSLSRFAVHTHTFQGQHVRHNPGATRHREEDVLLLEAKQYIPIDNLNPKDGDVTVLGSHALGFSKEMYEPLWDELLDQCRVHGIRIRSIWIADISNHGASGVLNEHVQGDDPSFYDNALDIMQMINTFRDRMPQPIIGFGHSMGGNTLIHLSLIHPRILVSLVLLDPVVGLTVPHSGATWLYMNSRRQDLWPSKETAERFLRSSRTLQTWDPRAMALFLKYGLRDTPTLLYPQPGHVTLRTSKAQEGWAYARNWFDSLPGIDKSEVMWTRAKYPDMNESIFSTHPFFRSVDKYIWQSLPFLRPSVLYIVPECAPLAKDTTIEDKVGRTGTGDGGSGGAREGRVSSATIIGVGHFLPFEKPADCATIAAQWLEKDLRGWRQRRTYERKHRDDKSINQVALSEKWVSKVQEFFERSQRAVIGKPKL